MKAQPSESSLPASARSCVYGGSSRPQLLLGSMRPLARSNFQNMTNPRYLSLYEAMGSYSRPSGAGY